MQTAARIALVEIGVHYWVKATLKGVIASVSGRPQRRALLSFEKALDEVGKVADPVRKLLAELGAESRDELESAWIAYQQGKRHRPEDLVEAAAAVIDDAMKSDPDARARFGRRWGFSTGGSDGHEGAEVA